MLRNLNVGAAACALCVILAACQTVAPTSGEGESDRLLTTQILGLDRAIIAREGQLRAAAFEVLVTDSSGAPAAGVPVRLWVASGAGEVVCADPLTDSTGLVKALYFLKLPFDKDSAVVCARAGVVVARAAIYLRGDARPAEVTATFHSDYHSGGIISFRVLNQYGAGVPFVRLAYRAVEGDTSLTGSLTTNRNGWCTARWNPQFHLPPLLLQGGSKGGFLIGGEQKRMEESGKGVKVKGLDLLDLKFEVKVYICNDEYLPHHLRGRKFTWDDGEPDLVQFVNCKLKNE